jgi:hypothetical protein
MLGAVDNVNQTICGVDIAGYGSTARTWLDYAALRDGMYASVRHAFVLAGIPWDDCYSESTGDGLLVLAPATVPKGAFAGPLLNALATALREYNESRQEADRVRLRLVLHAGEITRDRHGPIGRAIIHARRLLDAEPLKDALATSPGPLAVIVSDWFYTEVVWQRTEYAPRAYRRVEVEVKETSSVGWVRLPDLDPPTGSPFVPQPRWREGLVVLGRRVRRLVE